MAISNILYGSFLENPFLKFLFIVFVFYLLSRIVQLVILGNIRRLTKKTKTKLDDLVIDAIKKPLLRFLALIGVKIAVNVLPLSEKVLSIFHQILNSLLMFVVVLLMVKLMDIIINVWGKNWAKKTESSLDDDILPLLHKTSHIVLMTAGVFFILGEWNIDLTGLLAGVGIAGLAIGFAVKDSLANIFGGISIILDKALKVNDVIKLENGSTGTIVDIGLRSTKIRTWNNELLIIPNGTLANSTIQNYKKPDLSVRTEVSFGVEYGSDIDKVKELIEKTLKKVPKVMKTNKNKSIQVLFLNMGDSALEFKARFWVKNYGDKFSTKVRATEDIYKALTKSKIGIPFPTRTVYLKKE